ncbi:PPE family protein [Mycobacterium sp. M1]|uniref:PPE family protein n=1 Tax=Mycolicibacter acidiphilus TaxID=2835306 RepID=A0ABS5RLE5_9MYCO|nr:PPE family protein [Mycolicibacter acidiphilus]MBS9534414.1 PPE family protein [Mycolicibacter acidiphilus]
MTAPIWMASPPEVYSTLLSSGPGAGPLLAAAAMWESLSTEYASVAEELAAMLAAVQAGTWQGPSAESYLAANVPYLAWLTRASGNSAAAAAEHQTAATAYTTALAAMPTLAELAANHAVHGVLVATNFFGINTVPIALNEADYIRMWVQAATTMATYQTVAGAAVAATPQTTAAPQIAASAASVGPIHVHHHLNDPGSQPATQDSEGVTNPEWWESRWDQLVTAVQNDLASPNPFQSILTDGFLQGVIPHYAGEVIAGLSAPLSTLSPMMYALVPTVGLSGAPAGLAGLAGLAGIQTPTPIAGFVPDAPPQIVPGAVDAVAPPPAMQAGTIAAPPAASGIPVPSTMAPPAAPPGAPPVIGAQGFAFPYLVAGPTSGARASLPVRTETKAAAPAAAATAGSAAQAEESARRKRRRRTGLTDPGDRYEYLDAEASAHGAGVLGFTGTNRAAAATATGMTTLTADVAADRPTIPMVPHTWAPGEDPDAAH